VIASERLTGTKIDLVLDEVELPHEVLDSRFEVFQEEVVAVERFFMTHEHGAVVLEIVLGVKDVELITIEPLTHSIDFGKQSPVDDDLVVEKGPENLSEQLLYEPQSARDDRQTQGSVRLGLGPLGCQSWHQHRS